ncbi:hypothetical protein CHO01_31720 [Cellulomonas hominis]|uniref:Aminoglycoside phosphotransferase domain-containing protein n=1 Tax=Cellulomonas hominis TaxID=156981 RepID=A0A511FFN0_9CELL|nr:phosphotransferase [Cellulomonas hominis]MBB5474832.1 hypothetical protein [Cellulomonas hominis]NKY05642.1 hypothetical protein [Cellulomonas hominis]GEL48056.1 hypothetical protein CHO01_31720 [Cellulomonas hominis]
MLPTARLQQYAAAALGEGAGLWLRHAQASVRAAAAILDLELEPPHPGAGRSLVVPARTPRGDRVAVRVDLPGNLHLPEVTAIGDAGVGPRVVHADQAAGLSVVQWLPGKHPNPSSLGASAAVGRTLSRLRATPAPSGARPVQDVIGHFLDVAVQRARRAGLEDLPRLLAADVERSVELAHVDVLAHGDLTAGNVLLHEGRAWLIDADPYAGPIERDLATWILRVEDGQRLAAHAAAALRALTDVDVELLEWLVAVAARTFVAYRASLHRDVPAAAAAVALDHTARARLGLT